LEKQAQSLCNFCKAFA